MFEIGKVYHRRTELHDVYGGNRQSASLVREHPYIFLFSAPAVGSSATRTAGYPTRSTSIRRGQLGNMDS